MGLKKASRRFRLLGTLVALSITTFLVSDAAAQGLTQYCECTDAYDTVAVRTTPVVRRTKARKYSRAKRTTVARRSTTRVVRPAYQAVYVPAREVVYDDDDCVDESLVYSTANRRVVVTERIYPVAGSRYYVNGYNGDRITRTNGFAKTRVYVAGNYSDLDVDADYYSTARIASDYGYRDGFSDGHEVGMERETYNPYKEGDYRNGTNGYEGHFGSKFLYKEAYRQSYLRGYDAGFRSVAQSSTFHVARW